MNRNIKIAWLLSVLLWTLTDQAWAICDPLTRIRLDGQEDLRELVVQITHATGDSSTIDTYLGTLPCFGDLYVVEGDLLMTEAEVRGHYYQMHAMKEGAGIAPLPRRNDELIVAMHEGQKAFGLKETGSSLTPSIGSLFLTRRMNLKPVVHLKQSINLLQMPRAKENPA